MAQKKKRERNAGITLKGAIETTTQPKAIPSGSRITAVFIPSYHFASPNNSFLPIVPFSVRVYSEPDPV